MLSSELKKYASTIGFDLCGVVRATEVDAEYVERVEEWLSKGHNGTMSWMERNKNLRYDPRLLHEGCRSIVVCGLSYQTLSSYENIGIADFARGVDYHFLVKQKLRQLSDAIVSVSSQEVSLRVFCDSAPILERYWAEKAGFGWIGRNSMLINREFGSWFLIGVILLDVEFDSYDTPKEFVGCGNCSKCIDVCPSNAINDDKTIDVNRCISYLTVEHKGELTEDQQSVLDNSKSYFFGCDVCIKACPWNIKSFKKLTREVSDRRESMFDRALFVFPKSKSEITPEMIKQLKKTPLARMK